MHQMTRLNELRGGPVSLSERILFIDVLRGAALFGILAANMRGFFAPLDIYDHINVLFPGRADVIVQGFLEVFISGKFVTLFSFMFGIGFAIQMGRAEARGVRFMGFYPRRLLALLAFGLVHGIVIWGGDILFTYALGGGLLLLFRNRQQKSLLWWAGSILAVPLLVNSAFLAFYTYGLRYKWMLPKEPDLRKLRTIVEIYARGSVPQILAQNWVEWKQNALAYVFLSIYVLALFLLGMWVWRAGIVQRLGEYRPVLKRVCAWCLVVGIALNLYVAVVSALIPPGRASYWMWSSLILFFPSTHVLGAGYASGLALLFLNERWRPFLTRFAAVGRMALTDYLMQSIVCTVFFYHYTTGLYGRVGPAMGLVFTVVLFTAQVIFSNWWVSHYRFGPMEWLWRGLTYGSFPAMAREESPVERSVTATQDRLGRTP